jgi:hypothetical protein
VVYTRGSRFQGRETQKVKRLTFFHT